MAVSKTKPVADVQKVYDWGQRIFGENKVQELCDKYEQLPKDIAWHMIGHLQRNKVKYIAPFIDLIHGVDSLRLLQEIDRQAGKNNRVIKCLLQVFIATEEHKFGLSYRELLDLLESKEYKSLKNIQVCGLMGMATFTENTAQIHREFAVLKDIFNQVRASHFADDPAFNILSMGMSGDYEIAIAEGSNMVRIGSAIFGARDYTR